MNEQQLKLPYFQQQVAEKYGYKDWGYLKSNYSSVGGFQIFCEEAAEAYAAYRYAQGKQEAEGIKLFKNAEIAINSFKEGFAKGVKQQELLKTNLEKRIKELKEKHSIAKGSTRLELIFAILELEKIQSILNGLKQEEGE